MIFPVLTVFRRECHVFRVGFRRKTPRVFTPRHLTPATIPGNLPGMRQPSIVRIAVPRREPAPPPPRRNAARELLGLTTRCDTLLSPAKLNAHPDFSATELRVLEALPRRAKILARDLGASLGLDAGYLSRILARLEAQGLIRRKQGADRRRAPLAITTPGRLILRRLGAGREKAVARLLAQLPDADRNRLGEALAKSGEILARLT